MSRINIHNYEAFLLDYSEGHLNEQDLDLLKAFAKAHPELEIDLDVHDLPHISKEAVEIDFKPSLLKTGSGLQDEELLNYLEGNLSPDERSAFEIKLSQDQELVKELALYKKTFLIPEPVEHGLKTLLKTEEDLVINNRVIAYVENLLSAAERAGFERDLKIQPGLQKELGLVLNTVLTADPAVVYPDKNSLKKKNRVIALFNYRTAASIAAAVLLLLGFAMVFNYNQPEKKQELKIAVNSEPKDPGTKNRITHPQENAAPVKALHEPRKATVQPQPAKQTEPNKKDENSPVAPGTEEPLLTKQQNSSEVIPVVEQKNQEVKTDAIVNTRVENTSDSVSFKYSSLIALEEADEEDELASPKVSTRKGLWKRAVQVARQANKLGVKSIDGEENSGNRYRLSFNSFSVEKK